MTSNRCLLRACDTNQLFIVLRSARLLCTIISAVLSCYSTNVVAADPEASSQLNQIQLIEKLQQQINQQQIQIDSLINNIPDATHQGSMGEALILEGFFDVTAHTTDTSEHPFDLGGLELDIQFNHGENFAVSTALVWEGDAAEVAVAVLDYHVNTHTVPTRGRLFGEPGYHIQFGRFDIPFGIDYEFFGAPDRPNVSAPLTTLRIQNDGFAGDGIRAYGTWSQFDYAVYWTNSLFEDNGTSVGTRIGIFPARDPFSVHNRDSQSNFILGVSWLYDMDSEEKRRNELAAIDITWRYGIAEFIVEYITLDSVNTVSLPLGGTAGPADEDGYNARLLLDFDPMAFFVSYGEWTPEFTAVIDEEDPSVSYNVNELKRITVGARYTYDDYLQVKLEYLSHLDTVTDEPDFEKRRVTFQMVASF